MRLQSVNKELKDKMKKISKNLDSTLSITIRKEMRKILNQYPEDLINKKQNIKCAEIRMRGISPKLQTQFETLAYNKGLTTSQLLTLHLPDVIAGYPDWMVRFEE